MNANPAADLPDDATAEQIRADIDATRDRLVDTVEALVAKTDVKSRLTEATRERAEAAKVGVQANLQSGLHAAEQRLGEPGRQLSDRIRSLPAAVQLVCALAPVAALIVVLIVVVVRGARR